MNHRTRRDQRREDAIERAKTRAGRTPAQQLGVLERRPGSALKESTRLTAQIAEQKKDKKKK